MDISKKELMRIADICMLDFTDEEYDFLKRSLETTITEAQILFDAEDNDSTDIAVLSKSQIKELALESLKACSITDETQN